jgi:hypothetical protein
VSGRPRSGAAPLLPTRLKAVELGRDNTNIITTFTFEYENEIEFGKVGNENENELAGYKKFGTN